MIEITYQMVLSTLQTLSLIVGMTYYLLILNNQQKNQKMTLETRQASIFTQLAFQAYSTENLTQYYEILQWKWKDPQDFFAKYGSVEAHVKRMRIFLNLDLVGRLMREGLIDHLLVSQLLGAAILGTWNRFESIIKDERKRYGPHWMGDWEFAVQEIKKVYDPTYVSRLSNI